MTKATGDPSVQARRLGPGGRWMWQRLTTIEGHPLTDDQLVILLEACRCKDRLDRFEEGLDARDSALWLELPRDEGEPAVVMVDKAITASVAVQNMLKQLVALLRLPDSAGTLRLPGKIARGAHAPKGSARPKPKVTSLDRLVG